jgi:hypothetical protein
LKCRHAPAHRSPAFIAGNAGFCKSKIRRSEPWLNAGVGWQHLTSCGMTDPEIEAQIVHVFVVDSVRAG